MACGKVQEMKDVRIKKPYGRVEYTEFDDGSHLVYNLYVNVRYRGRGYAHKLLRAAWRRIRRTYPGPITIVAIPGHNTTITKRKLKNFYHSLGFEVVDFY